MALPVLRPLSWCRLLLLASLTTALCFCPLASHQAAADEAGDFVQSLFGSRIEKVQQTRTPDDDLALMAEMLDVAPSLPQEPDARSAVYARIIGMTQKPLAGYDLAEQAMDRLAQDKPDHPLAGPEAKLTLYKDWYRNARRDNRRSVAEK